MMPMAPPVAPPPAAPPVTPPAPSLLATAQAMPGSKVLTDAQTSAWWNRIQAALEATKSAIERGKINVGRYNAQYFSGTSTEDRVVVPTDFYYTEQKKSQLFYRLPDVFLQPQMPGLEDPAVVFQAALNKDLGPAGVNVLPRIQQVIFDIICAVGFGAVKVGYQVVTDGTQDVPLPDGSLAQAPNIIAAWRFIEHVSPGDLLVPAGFKGLDFDDAPFLGCRFEEDVLDDDETGGSDRSNDDRRLTPLPPDAKRGQVKQRVGYEIWYKAHRFDQDIKHPDCYRMFKVYDDDKQTAITVKDSPYQHCAPSGKLIEGMRGNPVCPVTIRYVSDTWMPQSDCTMARATADELSDGRTSMVQFRKRSMPQTGFDATRITQDALAKIERNENAAFIGFDGPFQDATWDIAKGQFKRESFEFSTICKQDLADIWGISDAGRGNAGGAVKTATVEQIAANAAQARSETERNMILGWFVGKVVPKHAALMQMFADEDEWVELLGSDAQRLKQIPPEVAQQAQAAGQDAKVLVPWNADAIKGKFAFSAKPNSHVYLDSAQEDNRLMERYRLFGNSPTINRAELERSILVRDGFDPSKLMQQPPPKSPNPPTLTFSINGQDLVGPQAPIVLELLAQEGITISPGAVQQSQGMLLQQQQMAEAEAQQAAALKGQPVTKHPGAVQEVEPLAKHPETGGMQGSGELAPMGAGGQL